MTDDARTVPKIPCDPYVSGLTATRLLARRKHRYFGVVIGWFRGWIDPFGWRSMPPTRDELTFYANHQSRCYDDRIDFDLEGIVIEFAMPERQQAEWVVMCLEMYAAREAQRLDRRPWYSKALDGALIRG